MIGGRYLFYGGISATEILAFGIAAFAYIFRGRRCLEGVLCYFITLYSVASLYRALVFFKNLKRRVGPNPFIVF